MKRINLYAEPEHVFLILALLYGIVFAALLPPLAGPDEYFHYQRIATVAYGQPMNTQVTVPAGIATLLDETIKYLHHDSLLPYSREHFFDVAKIPLDSEQQAKLMPSFMTHHSPVNYIPQAIAFRLASMLGSSPLQLLYICRLIGLLASVLLTFHAIRIMPVWRYTLAACALLPPLTFYRTCLSADTLTTSIGLLFFACVLKESVKTTPIKRAALLRLQVLALLLGACKLPYIAGAIMILAIPTRRFASAKAKLFWCIAIAAPGALAGAWWMEITRMSAIFAHAQYDTWGGHANPDAQTDFILSHPLAFAGVLWNTLSSSAFYVDNIQEMFGHFGGMLFTSAIYYTVMTLLLLAVIINDGSAAAVNLGIEQKALVLPVVVFFMLLTLTALYIHWNGVGQGAIKGFQGRYIYPLLPLLLMLIPFRVRPHAHSLSAVMVVFFALVGLTSTIPLLCAHWK